eukprot:g18253.t1
MKGLVSLILAASSNSRHFLLASAQVQQQVPPPRDPEHYSGVAAQLIEDECPDARPQFVQPLRTLAANGLVASEDLHLRGPEASLASWMSALAKIFHLEPYAAFECPLVITHHVRKAADAALYLMQKKRARVLLQIGNMFKLSAMSRWYTEVSEHMNGPD